MSKRRIAIPIAALTVAGLAGGAYAASRSSSDPQQAFIKDAAGRLHVSAAQLTGALKQALIDRIDAAVAAGRLTRAQANAIKQRIEQAGAVPFGPGFFGPPPPGPRQFPVPGPFGHPAIITSAASYLGLSGEQLMRQLGAGRSLAQVAKSRGKTVTGLEKAITAAVTSQLARAVHTGHLPAAAEQRLVATLRQHIGDLVTMKPPADLPLWAIHPRLIRPPGGPLPGTGGVGGLPAPPVLGGWAGPAAG